MQIIYLHEMYIYMQEIAINRLKAVLAEKRKTGKWLAEKLNKSETTISRWCRNDIQPSMDSLFEISLILEVDIKELLNSTKENK